MFGTRRVNKDAAAAGARPKLLGDELKHILQAEQERARARAGDTAYYIPEAQEDGKSERVQLRLPPAMFKAASILIGSGKTPYLTLADLVRSAVYIHLVYCYEATGLPKTPLVAVELMNQSAAVMQESKSLERAAQNLMKEIQTMVDAGNHDIAFSELGTLCSRIAQFPKTRWRDRLLEQLKRRWEQLRGASV